MSKHYSKRPSELLGITDTYTAYCLDEAACLLRSLWESADDKVKKQIRWSDTLTEDGMVKGSNNEGKLEGFLEQFGGVVG